MRRLPNRHRKLLKEPFGSLFPDFSEIIQFLADKKFSTVGDVVTANAFSSGLIPEIAIIDGFTKRSPYLQMPRISGHRFSVRNPAGTLTDELESAIQKACSMRPSVIFVDGEEDLSVLPLIQYLSDGEFILYGQPDEGVVVCEITSVLRTRSTDILKYFEEL